MLQSRSGRLALCAFLAGIAASGCTSSKSSNPLSPTVAGPLPGVEITAPKPVNPTGGTRVTAEQQPVTLKVEKPKESERWVYTGGLEQYLKESVGAGDFLPEEPFSGFWGMSQTCPSRRLTHTGATGRRGSRFRLPAPVAPPERSR